MNTKKITTIGRAERIRFLDVNDIPVPAKIDTGADVSSVWATGIVEGDHQLQFVLFGPGNPYYTGKRITLPAGAYRRTMVENSFGVQQRRYVVKLRIEVKGRIFKASFSLADRSRKTYPVLLGRRLLHGKFLVDVSAGDPLTDLEHAKRIELKRIIAEQQ